MKSTLAPGDLAEVAWSLAYWYHVQGDYRGALDQLLLRRTATPHVLSIRQAVVEVDLLLKLGRMDAARSLLRNARARLGNAAELCFSAANAAAAAPGPRSRVEQNQLRWLNKTFTRNGFAPIELADPSLRLTMDNIAARPARQSHPSSGEGKISVLMPAYNAADTIAMAMKCVLGQTWTNLELIVVDDGSSDNTWSVIEFTAKRDARVVPIRHPQNRGVYQARNTALSRATGDLVTVHDADDWSHPEKLALQAIAIGKSRLVNLTKQIRVLDDMRVYVKPDSGMLLYCYPSLMMTRNVLEELGAWDEARTGADGELWERLRVKDPRNKVVLKSGVALSFHLFRENSLTMAQPTDISTRYYGARCQYIAAYRHWHKLERAKPNPDLTIRPGQRRFPVPHICKPGLAQRREYDLIFVSDFSLLGGTTASNVCMLRAAERLGLQCACFHWPRIEFATRPINPKIRRLLHEGVAANVVAGESLSCRLVIINHPPLLNQLPDILPQVETAACVVIVSQTPWTRSKGGCQLYDLAKAVANVHAAFGVQPELAPLSPTIRRFLYSSGEDLLITNLDWTPIIDSEKYRRRSSSWSGSRTPVIGRHGRDSPDKWPKDRQALCQAYCANASIEVRILGGARNAKRVLGRIPSNWVVLPFDSMDVQDFLSGLDFFVHYPHEHWIEAFGRTAMEAMTAGVVAILPPHFVEIFADAAVYAEPTDVLSAIRRLWSDKDAYEAQILRGLEYVERTCAMDRFEERLRPYLRTFPSAPQIRCVS